MEEHTTNRRAGQEKNSTGIPLTGEQKSGGNLPNPASLTQKKQVEPARERSRLGSGGARGYGGRLADWLASLCWHVRYDLTFRVGTQSCDVALVTPARAQRRLEAFLARLAKCYRCKLTYFAAAEMQSRGVLHWHVLVKFWRGGDLPILRHDVATNLWQYWREWTHIPQSQGIEGHLWQVFINGRASPAAKYAAKYAAKSGGEWFLGEVARDGALCLEVRG